MKKNEYLLALVISVFGLVISPFVVQGTDFIVTYNGVGSENDRSITAIQKAKKTFERRKKHFGRLIKKKYKIKKHFTQKLWQVAKYRDLAPMKLKQRFNNFYHKPNRFIHRLRKIQKKIQSIVDTAWIKLLRGLGCLRAGSGTILFQVTFPVNPNSSAVSQLDLSNPAFYALILSNYVAGGLLNYLIIGNEEYSAWPFNKDYIYGTIFAQLLQENIDTAGYTGAGNFINNAQDRALLLQPGQGGPYQINNYAIRLPNQNPPSLGLINYQVLQASLGYTIEEQDNGTQKQQNAPLTLDNIYFAPLAAAYFSYNNLVAIQATNPAAPPPPPVQTPQAPWPLCKIAIDNGQFDYLDMILAAAYNAGLFSSMLGVLIDIGAYPTDFGSLVANLNNYSQNNEDYVDFFNDRLPSTSLDGFYPLQNFPSSYQNPTTTFTRYPRQVRYYIDQLTDNNANLSQYVDSNGNPLSANTLFVLALGDLKQVFGNSMGTLAYVDSSSNYVFIAPSDARIAFEQAIETAGETDSTLLSLGNSNDRAIIYSVLEEAFRNLESNLNFKLNQTTEEDHTVSAANH